MKKSKLFKTISFSSLALLMGAAGVFAFAPLGAGPSVAKASEMSTQASESLVIPKADDPVIFTTESGIEIKWGNAATASGGGNETGTYSYNSYVSGVGIPAPTQYSNLTSGNLSGFPYFTTTGNGKTYTWVIIGKNPNLGNASKTYNGSNTSAKTEYKTLADWQAKINSSDTYENYINGYSPTHKSFFNDTYEANTPAGVAIKNNGILNQTTARTYSASLSYSYTVDMLSSSSVKTNSEIPSGCVLVWSNEPIETFVWSSSYSSSANMFIDSNNTARKKCISYYNNDTFTFSV